MGIDEKALRQAAEALSHVHDYGRQSDLQAARVVVATYESAKQKEAVVDRVTGRDEHGGVKTEVDAELREDGVIHITDVRQWQHEIEGETASPAAPGMPSEVELARAWNSIADEHNQWSCLSLDERADFTKFAEALIRPAFEAKEREIAEWQREAVRAQSKLRWNIDDEGRLVRLCDGEHDKGEPCEFTTYVPEQDLRAAEAKLREANMQALSDEGQMRDLQAKLAQAVEAAFRDGAKWSLTAGMHYRVEDMNTAASEYVSRRARSASEHLTDVGEKT